jgi:hypothetical protein
MVILVYVILEACLANGSRLDTEKLQIVIARRFLPKRSLGF